MYRIDNISGKSAFANQIHKLDKLCFPREFWSLQLIENELSQSRAVYLACFCGDTIAGYLNATLIPDEAELNRIAVDVSYRRNGIATLLLNKLKEISANAGCSHIYLEVRKSNQPARLLYREHGYTEDAVRTDYYHNPDDDAILMSLQI